MPYFIPKVVVNVLPVPSLPLSEHSQAFLACTQVRNRGGGRDSRSDPPLPSPVVVRFGLSTQVCLDVRQSRCSFHMGKKVDLTSWNKLAVWGIEGESGVKGALKKRSDLGPKENRKIPLLAPNCCSKYPTKMPLLKTGAASAAIGRASLRNGRRCNR